MKNLGRMPQLPTLAHLAEHLTVVVSNFIWRSYQRVAGSIPASRKFIFNTYLKYLLNPRYLNPRYLR